MCQNCEQNIYQSLNCLLQRINLEENWELNLFCCDEPMFVVVKHHVLNIGELMRYSIAFKADKLRFVLHIYFTYTCTERKKS